MNRGRNWPVLRSQHFFEGLALMRTRSRPNAHMTAYGKFLPIHRQTRLDPSDWFALGHS